MAQSVVAQSVMAQSMMQPLLEPVVLPEYSRDRNVSVAQAPHPDYDVLGMELGSFQVFPSVTATSQINSNIFYNDFNKHGDVVALVRPTISAQSDWSDNALQFYATDEIRQDAKYTIFDRNTGFAQINGRADLTNDASISALLQFGHFTESPYSSVASGNVAVLSAFNQVTGNLKGVWIDGKLRLTAEYDYFSVRYSALSSTRSNVADQRARDNQDNRAMVQGEYSLSPSLALYSQVGFDGTRYPYAADFHQPDRNSTGVSWVGGVNLDVAGMARGAVGVGYSHRAYDSGAFPNPSGLSVQAKIEVFATPTTTLTGSAYRLLRDANTGQSVAYYDSRIEFDADHALRQNVILSARIYYGEQDFQENPLQRKFYQASIAGVIKLNRRVSVDVELGYNKSTVNILNDGVPFGQFIGSIALQYGI